MRKSPKELHEELEQVLKAKYFSERPSGQIYEVEDIWSIQYSNPDEIDINIHYKFDKLYILSESENYFWQFCSFRIFKDRINEKLVLFKDDFQDANDIDFWKNEIKLYRSDQIKYCLFVSELDAICWIDLFYIIENHIREEVIYRQKKKFNFIRNKLKSLQKLSSSDPTHRSGTVAKNKIPARYYALYHWVLIEMGKANPFEYNTSDRFKKSEIQAFAKNKYPQTSSQGFYKEFIDIDITKKNEIAYNFGSGYKDRIIEISNNDASVITHLKKYPN